MSEEDRLATDLEIDMSLLNLILHHLSSLTRRSVSTMCVLNTHHKNYTVIGVTLLIYTELNDVKECEAYNPDESSVEPFKADWNILSNFFVCHVVAFGRVFRSAEHAYQYRKCRDYLRNDLADKVIRAATPKKAKDIAAEIDPRDLDMWHKSNGHNVVMAEVLLAKARSNIDF